MATSQFDVAVVGGGPAGLAAAGAAGGAGCSVALLDAGPRLGGQYWRHPAAGVAAVADLQHNLRLFSRLHDRVSEFVTVLTEHSVWSVGAEGGEFAVRATSGGAQTIVRARALVLAPGAYDRQLPFPGWDLPGVFTAGGAQALLKGNGVLAGRRIAVAGTGPFLLPVAAGLARRGARVVGVFEANSSRPWLSETRTLAASATKIGEALSYGSSLARHRIPYRTRHAVIAAHGDDAVDSVTVARLRPDWSVIPGTERRIDCDAVAVGWGFTPQVELPLSLGVRSRIDLDGSLVCTVDDRQGASIPGVYVAGEATGVGGASLAVVEGEIAGRSAAGWLRSVDQLSGPRQWARPSRPGDTGPPPVTPTRLRRQRRALRTFAQAMHRAHPVRDGWIGWLPDDTLVCRCEEVAVAAVRTAVHQLGATDARSVKLFSRVGMGWCQGRVCGFAASSLVASLAGTAYDPHGFAERPVAVPLSLRTMAQEAADPFAEM